MSIILKWVQREVRPALLLTLCVAMLGIVPVATIRVADAEKSPAIKKAIWKKGKSRLKVKGKHWGASQFVIVSNTASGEILGTVETNRRGKWKLTVENPLSVPCRVRAESGANFAEKDVKKAPEVCNEAPFARVFAFNDLGMHCYDKDFSVFSILPPFNVVHAQVVRRGIAGNRPEILGDTEASVYYSAVYDSNGSINTTSMNKTNFWDYVLPLFGVALPVDEGLLGARMPGADNTPQAFGDYQAGTEWFTAAGIPITNWDDNLQQNPYPLMGIQAFDMGTTTTPPPTFVVVPVSDEMNCSECHATNGVAADEATAARYGIAAWSSNPDPEIQYRENILILHDAKHATDMMNNKPALCFTCHYSPALDLQGVGPVGDQIGKPMLSHAVHGRHGKTVDGTLPGPEPPVIPDEGIDTCYYCHPGRTTQCLRGVMGNAGIICQDCHGGLLAVGGEFPLIGDGRRTPWLNEPKCQSCHTGDARDHLGADIRLLMTYDPEDPSATPRLAVNKRFAEEDDKLYRNSRGHGGMACEACHGSPHAEWPVIDPQANDNIAAIQLQGHPGPIIECKTCHADGPPLTTNGPHGLHNVDNSRWNREHEDFYERNPGACKACHGLKLEGTVLSRAADDRVLSNEDGRRIHVAKGTRIHCSMCHENPQGGGD